MRWEPSDSEYQLSLAARSPGATSPTVAVWLVRSVTCSRRVASCLLCDGILRFGRVLLSSRTLLSRLSHRSTRFFSTTASRRSTIVAAFRLRLNPAGQSVSHVRSVTSRSTQRIAEIPALGDKTTVVAPSRCASISISVEVLDQAVTMGCSLRAVLYHLPDGGLAMFRVVVGAVVGLH